jgi:hypothetical protein
VAGSYLEDPLFLGLPISALFSKMPTGLFCEKADDDKRIRKTKNDSFI